MDLDEIRARAQQSLREQEQKMYETAKQRNREFRALLEQIAIAVAPKAFNEHHRGDPNFPDNITTPTQWREFFQAVSYGKQEHEDIPRGWQLYATEEYQEYLALKEKAEQLEQANRRLERKNERLKQEKRRLGARIQALQSQTKAPATAHDDEETEDSDAQGIFANHPFWPTLPEIPDEPPAKYAASFLDDTWARDAFAVLFLAVSGWAFRFAVNEAMVEYDDNLNSPKAGTFGRLWKRLRRNNLTTDTKYSVGRSNVIIVTLTEHGKAAARAIADIEPTPSEWDTLLKQHGGEAQAKHNAGVILFCHRARQCGYTVEFCPDVDHAAEPDVLLRKGDERLYVEVESGSGTKERLMRKWRNMADLQGSVTLCAHTPEQQKYLAEQAKKVARHGKATNLHALKPDKGEMPESLWLETW